MISPDTTYLIPSDAKSIDVSSVDVDFTLKVVFTDQGYARGLRNGGAAAADIAVTTRSGNVTYPNVPSGGYIYGYFLKCLHTGTTATGIVAEK